MQIFQWLFLFFFVPHVGLEPTHHEICAPKAHVSTKFHQWGLLWIPKESNLNHLIFSQEHWPTLPEIHLVGAIGFEPIEYQSASFTDWCPSAIWAELPYISITSWVPGFYFSKVLYSLRDIFLFKSWPLIIASRCFIILLIQLLFLVFIRPFVIRHIHTI